MTFQQLRNGKPVIFFHKNIFNLLGFCGNPKTWQETLARRTAGLIRKSSQEDKARRMLRHRIWSDHDGLLRPGVNFINIINNVETLTRKRCMYINCSLYEMIFKNLMSKCLFTLFFLKS